MGAPCPFASRADDGIEALRESHSVFRQGLSPHDQNCRKHSACATAISGTVSFTNTQPPNPPYIPWSLPATRNVRPGERFEYTPGGESGSVSLLLAPSIYRTRFEFTSIVCP